jgi:CheY-like chemotaxis protein
VKTLTVEDELTSRILLRELLKRWGLSRVAMNGREAVESVGAAISERETHRQPAAHRRDAPSGAHSAGSAGLTPDA